MLIKGTIDESGTYTIRLEDMTAPSSKAPFNEVSVGYANETGGIIGKFTQSDLNIVNQNNAVFTVADLVYTKS